MYSTADQFKAQQSSSTAAAAQRTASAAVRTEAHSRKSKQELKKLYAAMARSLELAEAARADSDRAQKFSRNISWASLAIAVASLAVAVVALLPF